MQDGGLKKWQRAKRQAIRINQPKSMFIETHMILSKQAKEQHWNNRNDSNNMLDDTGFNHKYDEIVDKSMLQGISQH